MKNLRRTPGQARSWPILGLCDSFRAPSGTLCFTHPQQPAKGANMDQIINWMQNNWFELGTLVGQFTLLFAGLWFAGKILETMRATQQQMGALLRLSMSNGLEERSNAREAARQAISDAAHEPAPSVEASSMFSPTQERPTSYSAFEKPTRAEITSNGSNGRARASAPIASEPMAGYPITSTEEPTSYVSAPLTLPEEQPGVGKGVVRWLQAPVGNKRNGGSSLKKVVRWLQAPAR